MSTNASGISGVSCENCIFQTSGKLDRGGDANYCLVKPPIVRLTGETETESRYPSVNLTSFCAEGINKNTRKRFIDIILTEVVN